ncbi:BTAD domain-containing putative transcriptional regulator [Actinokineospora guangxiensis]|uniref:BTAD domain-containing putative transcriptional regulator n=1 Tax=Actinokineospora guangxiensis TaxID=1490288 RepID=A0ABW0EMF9_9PSEU
MDRSGLRFGVLGALDIARDGRRLAVVGPKLRVVLASLLVRANTTVTLDQLAEDLWGGRPPASARKAAQLHVVRLRRVVGAAALETRTDGYRMRLDPDQLDLLRFRHLVARARAAEPAAARALLAEALACWRGDALADVASEALLREAGPGLAEERLSAHERYLEVGIALGEPAGAVADLRALTAEHPWRESLWALLVRALHRCGRRADALEAYRTVRGMLVGELGVEPGPLLRAALAEVLGDDPPAVARSRAEPPAPSYADLDEQDRSLYRLLGRFPGPTFAVAAAAALAGRGERTRACLDRLADAGLLTRPGPDRYGVPDGVREDAVARARVEDLPGELAAADARLYDHYLGTAAAASARLYPTARLLIAVPRAESAFADDDTALRWLEDERANLVAAAEHATSSAVLRRHCGGIADALRGFVAGYGYPRDALALAAAAAGAAEEDDDRLAEVVALLLRGTVAYNASDYPAAISWATSALDLCGQNQAAEAECRHALGRGCAQLGLPREAMRHHERALAIARSTGDEPNEAREINYIGVALLSQGRVGSAIACHAKAVELSARLGSPQVRLLALNGLGLAHWTAGRMPEAAAHHSECVEICRRWGLRHYEATALVCLAETLCDLGEHAEAEAAAHRAREAGGQIGERRHESGVLEVLATAARRQGRVEEAVAGYTAALDLAREIGFRYGEVSTLIGLAAAHRAAGRPAEAAAHAERALAAMDETGMRVLDGAARTEWAAALLALGDRAGAARQVERALAGAREDGRLLGEARALLVSARVHAACGDPGGSALAASAAEAIFRDLGVPPDP